LNTITVSVITVSYNSVNTISETIKSVLAQKYAGIEYIIVDGGSTDGTINLINSFGTAISKFISEPDKGIYDAINKGIKLATGDIVGILNSDDFFINDEIIGKVADSFKNDDIDAVIGDVRFVDRFDTSKVVRYYSSKNFTIPKFKLGYMPAHPTFYARRELFEQFGYYKTGYSIAADFELMVRFLFIHKIKYKYLELTFLSMRTGGVSNRSFKSRLTLNKEITRALRENGLRTNIFLIYLKYLVKIFEYTGSGKKLVK
jgi:glycosyltransferase involved in cell wall biosynthesis